MSIVHKLYKAFHGYPSLETRGVFLDMYKVFDKVWHGRTIDSRECCFMARCLNSYQLRLVCHKVPSLDHIFSSFMLMTYQIISYQQDDTSLFSVVNDRNISANKLNKDLQKISEWGYKKKISFNPDLNEQAQEMLFSRKLNKSSHPKIFF